MIHSGIQGQLDEVSRSMWVCPWGHLCISSWEYTILEGGLVLPAFEGAGIGDPAVWRTSSILVAHFMCDLGQVRLSEFQCPLCAREDNRHMAASQDG